MKAQSFIARKLRFAGRLSTAAIAVSFFVIVLSMAISAGFRNEIKRGISDISGDISMQGSEEPIPSRPSYYDKLQDVIGVKSITPAIWKPGIVKGSDDISGVLVKGIPMPDSCSMQADIPRTLAKRLGLEQGDSFITYFIGERVQARRFNVNSVYDGIMDSEGSLIVLVPLSDMQRLCGWDSGQVGTLEVKLQTEFTGAAQARAVAEQLYLTSYTSSGPDEDILRARTAAERYPQLFDWLNLIDFNVVAIILLMTVVAGFNMISGLLILLFRNISTIGTLKSMGMTDKGIAGVFLRVAARSVLLGTLIGNGAALLFCAVQGMTHFIKLNPVNYFVSFVPVHINVPLILAVDAAAFGIIMLLLLIPSVFIARVDPSKTVRVK